MKKKTEEHWKKVRFESVKKGLANKVLKARADEMRKNPTEAEKVFKEILLEYKLPFSEQVPFIYNTHQFIFDFVVCNKWIVEIDGSIHSTKEKQSKDKIKDSVINHVKFKERRFKNWEVLEGSFNLNNWLKGMNSFYLNQ